MAETVAHAIQNTDPLSGCRLAKQRGSSVPRHTVTHGIEENGEGGAVMAVRGHIWHHQGGSLEKCLQRERLLLKSNFEKQIRVSVMDDQCVSYSSPQRSRGQASTEVQRQGRPSVIRCGWLRKQGGFVKTWHNRWFVLRGDQLHYYKDEEETKALWTPGIYRAEASETIRSDSDYKSKKTIVGLFSAETTHRAILKEEETMSNADNKAISKVTVTRQPLSLSMCRLNKDSRTDFSISSQSKITEIDLSSAKLKPHQQQKVKAPDLKVGCWPDTERRYSSLLFLGTMLMLVLYTVGPNLSEQRVESEEWESDRGHCSVSDRSDLSNKNVHQQYQFISYNLLHCVLSDALEEGLRAESDEEEYAFSQFCGWCSCAPVLKGVIFLPGNKVIEHPTSGDEGGKFLFEVIPGTKQKKLLFTGVSHAQEALTE
ncbi:hypothetical protein PAMP_013172 [Pampus punctatissimus]